MKLANLFTVNALIATLFGIAFLVAPVQVLATYGVIVTPGTAVVSRLFGAALIGYGFLTWWVRAAAPSDTLRSIVLALCVADGLGFIAALMGQLGGAVNGLGWSTVVIYGALAAGFAFLLPKAGGAATS
jgi:hypothetical protein